MWNGNVQVESVTRSANGQTTVRLLPRLSGNIEEERSGAAPIQELTLTVGKNAVAFQPGKMFWIELAEEAPAPRGKAAAAGKS